MKCYHMLTAFPWTLTVVAARERFFLLNMKQGLFESSLDYANRFKNARDVMNTKNGGVIKLTELNESTRELSKNLLFLETC